MIATITSRPHDSNACFVSLQSVITPQQRMLSDCFCWRISCLTQQHENGQHMQASWLQFCLYLSAGWLFSRHSVQHAEDVRVPFITPLLAFSKPY